MRRFRVDIVFVWVLGLTLPAFGPGPLRADDGLSPTLNIPGLPPIPLPPGTRVFGPNGPMTDGLPPTVPDIAPAAPRDPFPVPPANGSEGPPIDVPGRRVVAPKSTGGTADSEVAAPAPKVPNRKEQLDLLFGRLGKATDPDESSGIAAAIEHVWMRSGSDTADLLMARAMAAMGNDRHDVASALLDKIIALRPDWAEAWNKRATLRFLDGDDSGSMEDISHVLVLEPRHFGALGGMGAILRRNGLNKAALAALRRALAIEPANAGVKKLVDELLPEVEGRDL